MSDENLQNPFVLQCHNCNTIVADSFALIDYKDNRYVLQTMTSYALSSKTTSTDDYDLECVYYSLKCNCSFVLGKKYITVSEGLNNYAGKYVIDVEKVCCYGLGNSQIENTTLPELVNEIRRLQRMCVYLYKKQETNEK